MLKGTTALALPPACSSSTTAYGIVPSGLSVKNSVFMASWVALPAGPMIRSKLPAERTMPSETWVEML